MSAKETKNDTDGGILELIKIVAQALLLALVVRTLLFQPFNIPSGSMMDTLLVGDYLFVSKYSYGYSRYSVPFGLAPISGRVWSGNPERGDVAVFRKPTDTSTDYIKRVIGLPGDTIQVLSGVVHINGTPVKREKIDDFIQQSPSGVANRIPRYRETLPNGVSFETLDSVPRSIKDNTREFKVPKGHYFMMGDNRDNSVDSRYAEVGYVPLENFVGRAEILFFSIKDGTPAWQIWNWPWTVRWERIGRSL